MLSNLNQPVSVEIATNRAFAIAGVISQPAYFSRSNTISPVAAAVESIISTVPSSSPVRWWSITSAGIFEVMEMNSKLGESIVDRLPEQEIQIIAIQNGMTTMLQDGFMKVIAGETTIEEVLRVAED